MASLITARTGTEENLKLGSPQQGKTPRGWAGEQWQHQHNNCNNNNNNNNSNNNNCNNNNNKFNKPNLMWTTELDWRVSWRNRVKKTPSKLARLLSLLWPIEQSDMIKEEQKPSARTIIIYISTVITMLLQYVGLDDSSLLTRLQ